MTSIVLKQDGRIERYEPAACSCHATDAELLEHAHVTALAENARRDYRTNTPIACWNWPVSADDLRRAAEARSCADPDGAYDLAWDLMADWQDGRCAVCGTRSDHADHDHKTGLMRGWLCRHCNYREPHDMMPGGIFDRYRTKNPATILGLSIRYYSPITGWAEPAPPPLPLEQSAAYVLARIWGSAD